MNRRGFLSTLCGAVVAAALSLRMSAEMPSLTDEEITPDVVYRVVAKYLEELRDMPFVASGDLYIVTPMLSSHTDA
jgi:hypothetical protein